MKKAVLLLSLSCLIFLSSCGSNAIPTIPSTEKNQLGQTENNAEVPSSAQFDTDKTKNAILQNMPSDSKQLILDLNTAADQKDRAKELEIRTELKKLEEVKNVELEAALASGDVAKEKTLKKEIKDLKYLQR